MSRTSSPALVLGSALVLVLSVLVALGPSPALADVSAPAVTTWAHPNAVATTGPIGDGQVRRSPFYTAAVTPISAPADQHDSFVYMSVPRSGEGKRGYTEEDGAEFTAANGWTMSWSSFEYSTDVWVDVTLLTSQPIRSASQVTVRPTNLGLKTQLVNSSTIRVFVPFSPDGYRFSVEFDPEQVSVYNDLSGASGQQTTVAAGNRFVHTEPRNSMMVFANPSPTATQAAERVPTAADGTIRRPEPGHLSGLETMAEEILYFGPGTYWMGSDHHTVLPANVRWVYLAPGAYVKGAFRFPDTSAAPVAQYKVTGLGVLSGEQYVYEADTANGYQHSVADQCHSTCVKMLQFESTNTGQSLLLQGITVASPPYHSFVTYAHSAGVEVGVENFRMDVQGYKQVGSWYWQTDGIELYDHSSMANTFFHANDDVLKLYHSDVDVRNTVIWKNENGPVFQWGWVPRTIDNVTVTDTDVIHNRMYWKDQKYNTCVFNSSSHYEDMGATDRADVSSTVSNLTFTGTRVEGAVNCAIRVFALSNHRDVTIDGLAIDSWNGLDLSSQQSLLKRYSDGAGQRVEIGNEPTEGHGLLLHNYTVGGEDILKSGNNWASDELGRLNFDADTWDSWNATADGQPTGTPPKLSVTSPADGTVASSRTVTVTGTTDTSSVQIRVNGITKKAPVTKGSFSVKVKLPEVTNHLVVTATGPTGVMSVDRRTVVAYGTLVGSLTDPVGDDNGPGSYTYPTDSAFNPGSLDLTGLKVYSDGKTIRFVTNTAGPIRNPWGGNGMSTQRLNIYLRDGQSTVTTPMLPGTNTSAAGAWSHVIVADGRYDDAQFGSGVYDAALTKVGSTTLLVDPRGTIVASIPAKALKGVNLSDLEMQVSMFTDAEGGEGVGNVRPVYSAACAAGEGCPWFVGPYRPAGGAGEFDDSIPSKDTDVSDSNALDIISGPASQAQVMDWTRGPVIVPYVRLDR
ncbi:glucodextranase DOMON-like domain-containing protein [Aestuariimicrobium soli]|uniref:glucodextranase DOMON-like domain-containing protein n=1 Tax=Aestuariimicrobium soli TaxID=2035834 RepID=UPI003EB9711E